MAHGKFKVLDSDIHIIEPPDLWTRYIDPAFRDRAPIGLTEDEGDLRLAHAGKPWGRVSGVDADRNRRRQGRNYALNQERWRPYAERGWTSKVQLEAMDLEGIAVAETRRCVRELGFRGMFLRPNEVNGRNWHDPYYEPLWAALEELEVPLGFHEGSGSQLRQVGEQFGANYARELTMAPSAYFKRQCFVSVECDEEPVKHVIDAIGDDRIVFSTDFPHGDSKFPRAVESFLQLPISDESKRKILWDNCAAYYGLPA